MADCAVLIGRERERSRLEHALASAGQGGGGLLLVTGEAGVGKTRPVQEVLATCGPTVVTAAANQLGAAPYGPIVQLLRAWSRRSATRCGRWPRPPRQWSSSTTSTGPTRRPWSCWRCCRSRVEVIAVLARMRAAGFGAVSGARARHRRAGQGLLAGQRLVLGRAC